MYIASCSIVGVISELVTGFQAREQLNSDAISKVMGNLLYHMATRFKGSKGRASMLLKYISSGKIGTEQQLSGVAMAMGACAFLLRVFISCYGLFQIQPSGSHRHKRLRGILWSGCGHHKRTDSRKGKKTRFVYFFGWSSTMILY